jgi:hypothetical protein
MNVLEYYIVPNLTEQVVVLTGYYYNNIQISFSTWLEITSEDDFIHNYIQEFKKHFLLLETEKISIYAKNLSFAMQSFFHFNKNINDLSLFIKYFIKQQFKNVNLDELI